MAAQRLFLRTGTAQLTWPPPDDTCSAFCQTDPAPGLRDSIAKLRWGHEWIAPQTPVEERIVPDGAIHLLFVLPRGGTGRPYALVLGAKSEPTVVRLAGHIEHLEIELRPGAVPALLGAPAGAFSGREVALADVWGKQTATLQDRLRETRQAGQRLAIVQDTLAGVLAERPAACPPVVGEALRRIGGAGGNLRVGALAAGLGLSDRRLEQLFYAHVGLSPKATCRMARLRASLEILARSSRPTWTEIALQNGYFDQAHLVNEFKAMTGLAPSELHRRAGFGFLQDGDRGNGYLARKRPRRNRS